MNTNQTKKPEWDFKNYYPHLLHEVTKVNESDLDSQIEKILIHAQEYEEYIKAQARQSTIDEVVGVLKKDIKGFNKRIKLAKKEGGMVKKYEVYEEKRLTVYAVINLIQSLSKTGGGK